jgi:DNA polymerase-3 subunit alpha
MGAIKGIGDSAIASIMEARQEGNFESLSDFVGRIDTSKVNKRVIEGLIKTGALDRFGYTRNAMFEQIEEILATSAKVSQAKKLAVGSLFEEDDMALDIKLELVALEEYDSMQILQMEKESLGFYVSGHPLDKYAEQLDGLKYTLSSEIDELADGSQAMLIGKVEQIAEKISKKGNKFAIITIMDLHGNIELMLFEDKLKELRDDFDMEKPIAFKVQVGRDGDFTRLNPLKMLSLKDVKREKVKVTKEIKAIEPIKVEQPNGRSVMLGMLLDNNVNIVNELRILADAHKGVHPLKLQINSKLADIIVDTSFAVNEEFIKKAILLGLYEVE